MTMIKTLATKMVATFSLVALMAAPASAQGLSADDMTLAFGGSAPIAARSMSAIEMDETAGAAVPFGPVVVVAVKVAKEVLKPKGHSTNKTPSNRPKHEAGDARRKTDAGGEKGDARRPYKR